MFNENKNDFFGYFIFTSVIVFFCLLSFYGDSFVSFIVAIFCYIFLRFSNFLWFLVKKIFFFFADGRISRVKKD